MNIRDQEPAQSLNQSHNYVLDEWKVGTEGLEATEKSIVISFVKGSKTGEELKNFPGPAQAGVTTEQLLKTCLAYLKSVNVGELRNEHGDTTIFHIVKALESIEARKQDRINRNVLNTYKK